jgi:hypothetical protein
MLPDNIDDLFRQQLDGHATPPAPDLWARLSLPAADTDPVDATFQEGLRGHATPTRRELWERLEDEHLRPQPRRRRVVAWWQLSAAAVLLLMLVGGALWSGSWQQASNGGAVASRGNGTSVAHTASQPATELPAAGAVHTGASQPQAPITSQAQDVASTTPAGPKKNQEIFPTQATASRPSTSSTPIASTTRPRRPATAPQTSEGYQPKRSQPDVATSTLAQEGGRKTPAGQFPTTSQPTTPVLTPATPDHNAPALAVATPPVTPAATPEIIEVEVRRGTARPTPAPVAVAVADATPVAPARRRGLRLGGLLRQADHLVHGESVSLAEATGLPETVTLQARLGGRLVSRTIQL